MVNNCSTICCVSCNPLFEAEFTEKILKPGCIWRVDMHISVEISHYNGGGGDELVAGYGRCQYSCGMLYGSPWWYVNCHNLDQLPMTERNRSYHHFYTTFPVHIHRDMCFTEAGHAMEWSDSRSFWLIMSYWMREIHQVDFILLVFLLKSGLTAEKKTSSSESWVLVNII